MWTVKFSLTIGSYDVQVEAPGRTQAIVMASMAFAKHFAPEDWTGNLKVSYSAKQST